MQAVEALQRAFAQEPLHPAHAASRTAGSTRRDGYRAHAMTSSASVRTVAPPAGDAEAATGSRNCSCGFSRLMAQAAAELRSSRMLAAVVRDRPRQRSPSNPAIRSGRRPRAAVLRLRDAACLWCRSGAHASTACREVVQALTAAGRGRMPAVARPTAICNGSRARGSERPRPMTVLRVIAMIVALGGVLDPAVSLSRAVPTPVRLRVDRSDPDAADVAARLRAAMHDRLEFVDAGDADAHVVVGGSPCWRRPRSRSRSRSSRCRSSQASRSSLLPSPPSHDARQQRSTSIGCHHSSASASPGNRASSCSKTGQRRAGARRTRVEGRPERRRCSCRISR